MQQIRAIKALMLSDGRAGHYNLSLGLLAAASHLGPLDVERIDVRRGHWPGAVLARWCNSRLQPKRLLKTVYGMDATRLAAVDLVVSAGAETLAANAAIAQITGAANIFYGSLRSFQPDLFQLVLTSYPSFASRPRHAFALKPSLAAGAVWSSDRPPLAVPPARFALLVGGNSGECRYAERDWARLFAFVEALTQATPNTLMITNSRRTPGPVSDWFQAFAQRTGSTRISFADSRSPIAARLSDALSLADAAIVTDDSSSMVSDTIAAGLPVIGLSCADQALTANEQDYRRHLTENGWYRTLPLAQLDVPAALATLSALTPLQHNPQGPLAALLAKRLPTIFG
jgi:uncharacterized protein